MIQIKRHVGKLTNTGTRVYVVFRKLPDDPQNCLVIEIDRLPDMYQENLKSIVESREAQSSVDLHDVLNRKLLGDGQPALQTMHNRKFLRKVAVSTVLMQPHLNQTVSLEMINEQIDKVQNANADPVVLDLAQPTVELSPKEQAEALLVQARLLDEEATSKRNMAYALAPDLKPGKGRPTELTEEEKHQKHLDRLQKRKDKRKEDREAREAQKLQDSYYAKNAEVEAKVAAKIARDEKRLGQ